MMKCPRCGHKLDEKGEGHSRQCLVKYQKDMRLEKIREKKKHKVLQNKLKDPKYKSLSLAEHSAKKVQS